MQSQDEHNNHTIHAATLLRTTADLKTLFVNKDLTEPTAPRSLSACQRRCKLHKDTDQRCADSQMLRPQAGDVVDPLSLRYSCGHVHRTVVI